jgi:DNA-binding CsgD family transcriptional regulator/PAS domain-containing protein
MAEADEVLPLVGDIYDAALDPALWPAILGKICQFVGACMANMASQDAINKHANVHFSWGDDPHYTALYLERYGRLNPLLPAGLFFPVGQVFTQYEVVPEAEMRETRFYKEWQQPQGYVDFVACNLDKSATSCVPLTVIRHERDGRVDAQARRRMSQIVPHVRRAVLISKVVDLQKVEARALADTLDALTAAVFLADRNARIVHANAAAHALLADGAVVHATGGRLLTNDAPTTRNLHDIFASASGGDGAVGTKGIALALVARGETFVAHVLPLTSAARRPSGTSHAAVAAVFVHKAVLDLQSPLEAVARRFGLTAGEVRVLLAIGTVGGVAEAADALGLAEATVRTHLHRLFAKTGTTRQVDLVRLVSGFANPLID